LPSKSASSPGGLAAAARAHDRQEAARLDCKIEAVENTQRLAAHAEALGYAVDPELALVRHGLRYPD
jgi:hypothetical protein